MTILLRFTKIITALVLTCVFNSTVFGQEFSGTITDEKTGEPLFGASVVLTGTAVGSTTDFDGKFSFQRW